jgi:hypothetical protein
VRLISAPYNGRLRSFISCGSVKNMPFYSEKWSNRIISTLGMSVSFLCYPTIGKRAVAVIRGPQVISFTFLNRVGHLEFNFGVCFQNLFCSN